MNRKFKYIVALETGGTMEQPDFEYTDAEIISAYSAKEAESIYNEKHDCSYYYGRVVGYESPSGWNFTKNYVKILLKRLGIYEN